MSIRVLAPEVANQIAAGEVVERPASAVKELIENSLDADARDIRVEIRDGGRRLIRVQDDGSGIPADEVSVAFLRHATSKITSTDDLGRITTLGFRGEALASIASVAHVSLLTRTPDADAGTFVRLIEGREVEHALRGGPVGTSVAVEHLFANLPARLKFLKQPATEAAHIQQVVTRYALAYPERRFSLVSEGKLVFQSTGSGKLEDVLVKVYGLDMTRQLFAIGHETDENNQRPGRKVSGYIGVPSLHRGNRGYITLFVNRRWFQDTSVAYAVIQAYHTLLPVGRFPVAVIFLGIDPADVDVNVHPTKAEVRFREPSAIFGAVQKAVRRGLVEHAPIPEAGSGATALPGAWPHEASGDEAPLELAGIKGWTERREALLDAGRGRQAAMPLRQDEDFDAWRSHSAPVESDPPIAPSTPLTPSPQPEPPRLMPILRVVGQLAATYIVAEGPDGMYLIDQHAAHERVLYEQMLSEHAANALAIQPLLEPVVIDLSPEQAAVAAEELPALAELGLGLEPFGGSSYLLRTVPAILARGGQPERAVAEILDGLSQRDDVVESAHEARLITLICKRAAVKGNTPMTLPEMQELVRRLEGCRSPRTCPHGRPTMVYMSAAELAKQFGRI
ncbi:MAG: DNA mismatch repair endonuclease MutL [Nitrososphaerales archaeon]